MVYLHNLRVRLRKASPAQTAQERRNRLYRSGHQTYDAESRYLLQFLRANPYTHSLLTALDVSTFVDFEQWVTGQTAVWEVQFPESEEGRAKVCYGILKRCVNDENGQEWIRWGRAFSTETKFDPMLRDFTEGVVDPLINFLHDRIDDGGNVLHLIERFKLKAEWFRREELYNLYENNTSVGERNLDRSCGLASLKEELTIHFRNLRRHRARQISLPYSVPTIPWSLR